MPLSRPRCAPPCRPTASPRSPWASSSPTITTLPCHPRQLFPESGGEHLIRPSPQSPPVDARRLHPGRHDRRQLVMERLLPAFNDRCRHPYSERSNQRQSAAAEDAVTVTTANRGTSGLPVGGIACRSSLPGQTQRCFGSVTAQSGCVPLDVFGIGVASTNGHELHHRQDQGLRGHDPQPGCAGRLGAGHAALAIAGRQSRGRFRRRLPQGSGQGRSPPRSAARPAIPVPTTPTSRPPATMCMEGFAEVDAPLLKNNIVNSLDVSWRAASPAIRPPAWSKPGNWALPARSMTISSCAPPGRLTFAPPD